MQRNLFGTNTNTNNANLELKIIAFKRIYWALRTGQDNQHIFKSNFLAGKEKLTPFELAKEIKNICVINPKSRTFKAWSLAELHYDDCSSTNSSLFNEIYKYTWENTRHFGTTFFSQLTTAPVFSEKQIKNKEHTMDRMGNYIKEELDYDMRLNENEIKYENNH